MKRLADNIGFPTRSIHCALYVPDTDDIKQKNNNHLTIPSRFFPQEKIKRSFVLSHLCPVHKVLTVIWKPFFWTKCQFLWSGKVYIWLSVWELQKLITSMSQQAHACKNWETDHLQHDLYGDISYKFTLAGVFVFHACTQNNYEHFHKWFGTFSRDSELTKACIFSNHESWSLS